MPEKGPITRVRRRGLRVELFKGGVYRGQGPMMKRLLYCWALFLFAQAAYSQTMTVQDEIQQASQTFFVEKTAAVGFAGLGAILSWVGVWQLSNQAAAGSDFLYPNKNNFTMGSGFLAVGIGCWLASACLNYAGDLQAIQIQQWELPAKP